MQIFKNPVGDFNYGFIEIMSYFFKFNKIRTFCQILSINLLITVY
jgi:hypothetical protein